MMTPAILLDSIKFEQLRRLAEGSLYEFTKQAWHVIEPGSKFVGGWHLESVSEHLEAVSNGEIRDLIINMPPRHMKSIQVAVMWPVWTWVLQPEHRWLFASYAGSLSVRDSLKCRRLMQSPWFQARWGDKFKLTGDQNAKTFFENDKSGYRFATSVGAATTGHGGDTLVVDDPHNSLEAQSTAVRESVLDWWDQAMSTRLNNPNTGSRVIVQQRLHEADLAGHLLKKGGWEHLCLPAEWDGKKRTTSLGSYDPRTVVGDLLWPAHFDGIALRKLKLDLGVYGAAGQLQQQPAPSGGGILKTDHLQLWPANKQLPDIFHVLQSYDTAYTEKTSGDPSACVVFGVFEHKSLRCALVLDCWAENMGYPQLRKKILADWKAVYGGIKGDHLHPGRRPDEIMVEAKSSGQSLLQDLNAANIPAFGYNPGNADKIARAHQAAPIVELDVIYVLESKKEPGQPVTWVRQLVDQLTRFPKAEHDDLTDCFTQGIIRLRDQDFFETDYHEEPQAESYDYHANKKKGNPYNA